MNKHELAAKLYRVARRNIAASFCMVPIIGVLLVVVHETGQNQWLERIITGIHGLIHGFGFGMLALAWFAEQHMQNEE